MKQILISGIQPTGKLHLGNYLGALKNFVELQNSNKYQCLFFIADYHSLTEIFTPKEKEKQILDLVIDFLAIGLDPQKSVIFQQSAIPAHTELAWILNTFTPLGELRRMTQFKDKSENQPNNINVGLFDYPVLMAADILLYNAQFVPVGEDQLQHLELTRTLARKFNNRFGKTFTEPKPLLTQIPRLMSLSNPLKKMSKSQPAGCLFLNDPPVVIRKKIMSAVTDSGREIKYDPARKPAISNLIQLYRALVNYDIETIEQKFININYAEFKKSLAEAVINILKPFQENKKEFLKNPKSVKKIIESGNKKASQIANRKIAEIKKKIGLLI